MQQKMQICSRYKSRFLTVALYDPQRIIINICSVRGHSAAYSRTIRLDITFGDQLYLCQRNIKKPQIDSNLVSCDPHDPLGKFFYFFLLFLINITHIIPLSVKSGAKKRTAFIIFITDKRYSLRHTVFSFIN